MLLLPKEYWEVRKTKNKGKGVFALKDIDPGVVVGDYLGKMIGPDKEDEYERRHGFYMMYYHKNASIFPDLTKDGIHLFNHSCAPNCWMYVYKGHVLYFSLRKIFKGEELTISYLLEPQDKNCNPCTDICKCESFNCTQTMHLTNKKFKEWSDYDEKIAKKTKVQRVKHNEYLLPLPSYPKRISDNKIYTLIGNQKKSAVKYNDKTMPTLSEIRERIRKTGRYLEFEKLNLKVLGVTDDLLLTQTA